MVALAPIRWQSLVRYLAVAWVLALAFRFLGYAAAISYRAAFNVETKKTPREIADETYHIAGSLLLIGALALLIVRG